GQPDADSPGFKGAVARRPSRYRQLYDLIDGPNGPKQLFMLTATPINNKLDDFRHMVELFTRRQDNYFASTLGVNSLRGHFVRMERELKRLTQQPQEEVAPETNLAEAERLLTGDRLFQTLVEQRSRAYVKQSQVQQGVTLACFPDREAPRVVNYSVKKSYGRLLAKFEKAFAKDKPLFVLGLYYPLAYDKTGAVDPVLENRQKQVVRLIRTQFLKRFESSARAFEQSCTFLLQKLLAWVTKHCETDHEKAQLERWKRRHGELIGYVHHRQHELWGDEDPEDADEDFVTDEMLEDVDQLPRDQYKVEDIIADTFDDMDQLAEFLDDLSDFKTQHDDKLQALIRLLKGDPVLKVHKVLIFTEFAHTARYLAKELKAAGFEGVEQIDSGSKRDRSEVIRRFAPYYNGSSSPQLATEAQQPIRVLISTDILSEGLNLQDATRLINYDLHWNPVRLMQRIGRVDRRMNPDIEARILADHPDQKDLRGKIVYWNFLPPEELEDLLRLFTRVAHKTLRISKTFGIEGKKLLRPEDDYDALRIFNQTYEGKTTPLEEMHLEFQRLLKAHPELETRL
ncbi:MAG: DEAD/DEAH box helicase, partial [Planctomycetes bacterium]|nr:DEAD/DEAH box helicase [Planctomycetota bacterium]